ncbi:MAG: hypothetical protein PHT59_05685 [Candidatus Omnitrophica bacterium]|nr:hypothetical protein [Candidatus Omnitrophota bacterium]
MWFVAIVGASGIIAQVVLVRELLVSFHGNELTIGIQFGAWMLLEALAVFAAGRFVDRHKEKYSLLLAAQLVFVFGFPASIVGVRVFKPLLGFMPGQGLGLGAVIASSLAVFALAATSHAALFGIACSIFCPAGDAQTGGIGRVYSWETIGTVAGGLFSALVLTTAGEPLMVAVCVGLVNLLATMFLLRRVNSLARFGLVCAAGVLSLAAITANVPAIGKASLNREFAPLEILEYRNSVYANIVLAQHGDQKTLFYNGAPLLTFPHPDIGSFEEFGIIPLAFHPGPRKVLVLENGMGGLIQQVLKNPVERVDYLELDAQVQEVLKGYPDSSVAEVRSDPRLRVIYQDSRTYLAKARESYDVILIGLTHTSDLVSNRLFTEEFFLQAAGRLADNGIIAFRFPSSRTYLSPALERLGKSITGAASRALQYSRVIPGENAIVLVSNAPYIRTLSPADVSRRIRERGITVAVLVPSYISFLLDKGRQDWYLRQTGTMPAFANRDARPVAVFETFLLWNRQMQTIFYKVLDGLLRMAVFFIVVCILSAAAFVHVFQTARPRNSKNIALDYGILTTGFGGMLLELLCVFGFQVKFGYLYLAVGILIAVFMTGVGCASLAVARSRYLAGLSAQAFLCVEAAFIVFGLAAGVSGFLSRIPASAVGFFVFALILFFCGACIGAEFGLAAHLRAGKSLPAKASAALYAADLAGGCLAGLLGSLVLVPLLGFAGCALSLAGLKVTSFAAVWRAFVPPLKIRQNN